VDTRDEPAARIRSSIDAARDDAYDGIERLPEGRGVARDGDRETKWTVWAAGGQCELLQFPGV
jgi:hypothetical protein